MGNVVISGYITACGESVHDRDKNVNDFMESGWQPFGSAYVSKEENKLHEGTITIDIHCQPMVKFIQGNPW